MIQPELVRNGWFLNSKICIPKKATLRGNWLNSSFQMSCAFLFAKKKHQLQFRSIANNFETQKRVLVIYRKLLTVFSAFGVALWKMWLDLATTPRKPPTAIRGEAGHHLRAVDCTMEEAANLLLHHQVLGHWILYTRLNRTELDQILTLIPLLKDPSKWNYRVRSN